MKAIATENARDQKNGAVKLAKFSTGVRSMDLNNLRPGDIVTIPEAYEVLQAKVRGSENVFEYINVDVKRGENTTVARFTPSILWRNLSEMDANGNILPTRRMASGNVVRDLQDYADVDAFLKNNKGKQFSVQFSEPFKTPGYNGAEPRMARVVIANWVNA